jgi:hypothetical protein
MTYCPLTKPDRELMRYLMMVRDSVNLPEGFHYRGAGDFLLQHARFYRPQSLPRPELHGQAKRCFVNAAMAAINGSRTGCRLYYVEGYATLVIPTHHAWCADADGNVYEVTWRKAGTSYFGVEFLPRAMHRGTVLDDWQGGYKLYRNPFKPQREERD